MFFALLGFVIIVVVLVAAGLSLFVGRHGEAPRPETGWTATDEVFKDPVTDRIMRVWADESGQRHYLPEPHEAGGAPR
jgi:hypothetical protein